MPKAFFIVLLVALGVASIALAHQPHIVGEKTRVSVVNPEISKAYYGWLQGAPAIYSISSPKPFLLYLNLLSPRLESGKMDYSANVFKDGNLVERINGPDSVWMVTYEPFANDYYTKGPEYEAQMPAGDYIVEISNSGNSGNYALAVGKTEDISLGGFLNTLAVLPEIKADFFGKSPWEAYNNFIGLGALIMIVSICIFLYFAIKLAKKYHLKKHLDNEYGKHKFNRGVRGADRRGLFERQGI